ncbi:MAG TPA: DUF1080 domain-containing protein [Phycisphaerae bacterium]|nr:DUF1080 domain-containing protein [Phycisphaerae bacterium]
MTFIAGVVVCAAVFGQVTEVNLLESMDLWQRDGGVAGSFEIKDGRLLANWTTHEPADLITRADYENFELGFECKIDEYGESGLYIHAPRNGAWRAGIELELANYYGGGAGRHSPCSIFREAPPQRISMKPAGQWNAIKVLMDWPKLVVHINGELVHDLDLSAHPELRYKLRRGAIGIQNLGWGVEIRNMVLKPLPDKENAVSLFNGRDLSGWTVDGGKARWEVRDGAIRATGDGYLKHERVVEDFDLRLMVRTSPAANGGVYFRWLRMDPFSDRGHEIQILDISGAIAPTGSIYGYERGEDQPITPGRWELLQLFVRGKEVVVYLNGVRSCTTKELKHVRPGHICLQMHRGGTSIEYKDFLLVPAGR